VPPCKRDWCDRTFFQDKLRRKNSTVANLLIGSMVIKPGAQEYSELYKELGGVDLYERIAQLLRCVVRKWKCVDAKVQMNCGKVGH